MAVITKINWENTEYDIKDETARESITSVEERVTALEESDLGTLPSRVETLENINSEIGSTITSSTVSHGSVAWTSKTLSINLPVGKYLMSVVVNNNTSTGGIDYYVRDTFLNGCNGRILINSKTATQIPGVYVVKEAISSLTLQFSVPSGITLYFYLVATRIA